MDYVIIILNAAVLFIFYRIFSDRIARNSGLTEVVDKFKREINAVTVNFNRISVDNISMLEEKNQEVRQLLKLLDSKIAEYAALQEKYGEISRLMDSKLPSPAQTRLYIPAVTEKKSRKTEKPDRSEKSEKIKTVLRYFDEGKTVDWIAHELDISDYEVRCYLKGSPEI